MTEMAGGGVKLEKEAPPGFEPGNEGFADPCLTTWPWRPNCDLPAIYAAAAGVVKKSRFEIETIQLNSVPALRSEQVVQSQEERVASLSC